MRGHLPPRPITTSVPCAGSANKSRVSSLRPPGKLCHNSSFKALRTVVESRQFGSRTANAEEVRGLWEPREERGHWKVAPEGGGDQTELTHWPSRCRTEQTVTLLWELSGADGGGGQRVDHECPCAAQNKERGSSPFSLENA